MLSADAFSAFEEAGLEDAEAVARTGRAFRDTVLSLGGGRAPAAVFRVRRLGTCPILLTLESFFGQDSSKVSLGKTAGQDSGSACALVTQAVPGRPVAAPTRWYFLPQYAVFLPLGKLLRASTLGGKRENACADVPTCWFACVAACCCGPVQRRGWQ